MRKHLLAISIAIAAFGAAVGGCGQSTPEAADPAVPSGPERTAEETARLMLEALKTGDVDTFLAHADLRGMYEHFPAAMRKTFTFEQFKGALDKAKAKVASTELNEFKDLSYEILGVEERDGCQVVTFRTQTAPGRSWKVWEAYFRRFEGMWKITGRGVKRLRTEN